MNRGTITIRNTNSDNIQVYIELSDDGTIWMTKEEISSLFNVLLPAVNEKIKALLKSDKLTMSEVKKEESYINGNGQKYVVEYFNLDVIIALSYRIDSYVCILFRQWFAQQVCISLKSSSQATDRLKTKANMN